MAKRIKYQFLCGERPINKSIPYSEINETIASTEAYGGEYTVEDYGAEGEITKIQEE